jgi:hypothetical protein
MPAKKTKKSAKQWFTVAYLTREGVPHAAHWRDNFSQKYDTEKNIAKDVSLAMIHLSLGAYAAAVWPGQITEEEALHGRTKPLFYVHEDGSIELIP